jgi:UDP-3-O-[3-hydroxymyristoyl] glucosamine N-acyltransferase
LEKNKPDTGLTLAEIAERVGGRVRGDGGHRVCGVSTLERAGSHELAFVAGAKYLHGLRHTRAGAVLLNEKNLSEFSGNAIIVANPHLAYALVLPAILPPPSATPGVHPSSVIDKTARVSATATVGPFAVIEAGVEIGENAFIGADVFVGQGARIGAHVRLLTRAVVAAGCDIGIHGLIHPGAVIGADGFGFAHDGTRWIKVAQLGRVVIGQNVEIGANTTVDRGTLDDTVIGDGVKIDNLVQIAHNVRIGENTIVAGCVGIAGSAVIGKRCAIGGQAGIAGHLEICDDVQVLACSLITQSITRPGAYSSSLKAEAAEQWRRNAVRIHQLDEMAKRLRKIETQLSLTPKEPSD